MGNAVGVDCRRAGGRGGAWDELVYGASQVQRRKVRMVSC